MKFKDFLRLTSDLEEIQPEGTYTIAGVSSYGLWARNRRTVKGSELTMKKYSKLKTNQLIWCKVDTKNGSFSVTDDEVAESYVSTNMAIANIDTHKIRPQLLQLLFTVPAFYEKINSASSWTTNRKYLTPTQVLELEITEYSLEEQDLILTQYDKCMENKKILDVLLNPRQIEKLKSSILQDAIQWKLVSQDPSDEPASILIEKIQAEKAKLIAEWKLKKQKPLAPIKIEEIPYELPEGWEWVRLGDIINVRSSKRIFASDYKNDGIPFFRSKEIWDLSRWVTIRTELFISEEKYEEIKNNNEIPKVWDILLTSVWSIWNTWIVDDRKFYYKDWNITQLEKTAFLNNLYLKYYISSDLFYSLVWKTVSGTAYNALTIEKINLLKFPLPPLQEQLRIVSKIDELMKSCELLDEQVRQAKERSEKLMESVLQGVFNW